MIAQTIQRMMAYVLGPPNGSRLSCGASASGRKHPALRYRLAGAQTHASSESRPHQLQALVRRRPSVADLFGAATRRFGATVRHASAIRSRNTGSATRSSRIPSHRPRHSFQKAVGSAETRASTFAGANLRTTV